MLFKVNLLCLMLFVIFQQGCRLPKDPGKKVFLSERKVSRNGMKEYQIKTIRKNVYHRNMLFVALDEFGQSPHLEKIRKLYKNKPVRVEQILFWKLARHFPEIYDRVVTIPVHNIDKDSLKAGIDYMESLQEPYDVFLFLHGLPNSLVGTKQGLGMKKKIVEKLKKDKMSISEMAEGFDVSLITYEDLQKWKGQGPNMKFVYMQSCYGHTLTQDWLDVGAKEVIGFDSSHTNYFYFIFFWKEFALYRSAKTAFEKNAQRYQKLLFYHPFYPRIIKALGLDFYDYIDTLADPIYSRR